MLPTLALASLVRHPARTLLAVLGLAVSAALLLDMVMLAGGMRESFRALLLTQGFQLRLAPRGTLPFDTEALIGGADALVARLRSTRGVAAVSPVLGGQLHVAGVQGVVTGVALGIEPAVQGDYTLVAGRSPRTADELVANDAFLRAAGRAVGDTVHAAAGFDPQLRGLTGERPLLIVGRVRFLYLAADQRAAALPLATLRAMRGAEAADHVSLVMVRLVPGVDVGEAAVRLQRDHPRVTVISTAQALEQVDRRLSYFRQLALILGAVSLGVGFLLVTTLVTVSVNERVGEIAVMRAIGVRRWRIVVQVGMETAALLGAAVPLGLALGLATARYLNSILARFPGLPERIDFFLFQPAAAWRALGLLVAAGVLAAFYPAWRSASLPIAATLREEAVG